MKMRYLVFSDVHGNLEALERVLEEADRAHPDIVVSLGDVVGYGPDPNECILRVNERAMFCIAGNHDAAAAGLIDTNCFSETAARAIIWTSQRIDPSNRNILAAYDAFRLHGDCIFAHSSPIAPLDWAYIYTLRQAEEIFAETIERFVFIGHTHVPAIIEHRVIEGPRVIRSQTARIASRSRYLVNVGSVGQPRDGISAASFAILDTEAETIDIRRVPYDIRRTQERILTAGLPETLAARLATAR